MKEVCGNSENMCFNVPIVGRSNVCQLLFERARGPNLFWQMVVFTDDFFRHQLKRKSKQHNLAAC